MATTITFCMDNPIRTTIDDWMRNKGRVSVGREVDNDYFEILAYSDNEADFAELDRLADKENALHINSFVSEGVTFVD